MITPFPSRPARPRTVERYEEPGDDAEEIQPLEPFFASQMEGREPPPRRWVIDGVAQRGSVLLFSGATKIGKSLLMQQLMTSVTIGSPWLGLHCEQARTFALYAEDSQGELERRQAQINAHHDITPADYELNLAWQSLEGREAQLVEFDRRNKMVVKPLFHQTKAFCRDHGMQVIGLDNMRVLFGGNENWSNQVTQFVRLLVQWAIEIDGLIIACAHPAKNDSTGYAGTGAWLSSVRAGMSLRRPDEWEFDKHGLHDPRRVLAGLGSNYGPGLRTERIDYDEGVFIVADPEERARPHQGPLTSDKRRDMRYHLLVIMRRFLDNGGQVYADITHKTRSLPSLMRRSPNQEINRITMNDIELMQQEMVDAGQIEKVDLNGRCLLRPTDGPWYKGEQPWLPTRPPATATTDKAAAD